MPRDPYPPRPPVGEEFVSWEFFMPLYGPREALLRACCVVCATCEG